MRNKVLAPDYSALSRTRAGRENARKLIERAAIVPLDIVIERDVWGRKVLPNLLLCSERDEALQGTILRFHPDTRTK